MKDCPHLIGGMTYSNPLRVFRRRWLLCLVGVGCTVTSYLPDLVPVGYQIAVETIVSSSELLEELLVRCHLLRETLQDLPLVLDWLESHCFSR